MTPTVEATIDPSSDWLVETSLQVLSKLGVAEVEAEVSRLFVDLVVELAESGEVMPIDTSNPAGGFGGTDLLIATVVPALAAARSLQQTGALTHPALASAVDDIVRRVGSPRAAERRVDLITAICSILCLDTRGAGV